MLTAEQRESGDAMAATELTLRDNFAAHAMHAIASTLQWGIRPCDLSDLAADAYLIADAMLRARGTP